MASYEGTSGGYYQGNPPPSGYYQGAPSPSGYYQGAPPPSGYCQGALPPNGYYQGAPPPSGYCQCAPPPSGYYQGAPPPSGYYQGAPSPSGYYQGAPPPSFCYQGAPPPSGYYQGVPSTNACYQSPSSFCSQSSGELNDSDDSDDSEEKETQKRKGKNVKVEVENSKTKIQVTSTKKIVCPYGRNCYRKNPDHFLQFSHPPALLIKSASTSTPGPRPSSSSTSSPSSPASTPGLKPPSSCISSHSVPTGAPGPGRSSSSTSSPSTSSSTPASGPKPPSSSVSSHSVPTSTPVSSAPRPKPIPVDVKVPAKLRPNPKGGYSVDESQGVEVLVFELDSFERGTIFLNYSITTGVFSWTIKVFYVADNFMTFLNLGQAPSDSLIEFEKDGSTLADTKHDNHGACAFCFGRNLEDNSYLRGTDYHATEQNRMPGVPDESLIRVEVDAAARTMVFCAAGKVMEHGVSGLRMPLHLGVSSHCNSGGGGAFASISFLRLGRATPFPPGFVKFHKVTS